MTKTAWKKRIKDDCIQAGTYAEWCESIIDRWEKLTGEKAVLLNE